MFQRNGLVSLQVFPLAVSFVSRYSVPHSSESRKPVTLMGSVGEPVTLMESVREPVTLMESVGEPVTLVGSEFHHPPQSHSRLAEDSEVSEAEWFVNTDVQAS